MYLRWVIRRHKNAAVADTIFHDAYLVESYRDAAGSPRQRIICYLGNIRQIGADFPAIERELFLLRAERILLSISELNAFDRAEVLRLLYDRVPPLSDAEVQSAFTENLRWYRQWWETRGTHISDEELLQMVQGSRG